MTTETTKVVPLTCHGHSRPVTHLSFSAPVSSTETYYLMSACKDNNPMLRDGMTGDWIGTFIGHKGAVWQSRLSSDASLAATASADFSAKVWDTHTGECLATLVHNHIVRAVAFPDQPCPRIVATGGMEKKLRIWDLSRTSGGTGASAGSNTSSPIEPNGNGLGADHSKTANGASSNNSSTTTPNSLTPSYEIGPGTITGTIRSIAWAPSSSNDNNVLVTASDDKLVRWWDLRGRAPVAEYTLDAAPGSCELGEQGVLSVAAGKKAYFFDAKEPGRLVKSVGTPYELASVALSLGGAAGGAAGNGAASEGKRRFVTGSAGDTWVRVWDFDEERELEMGKGHHGPIWSVAFSPDAKLYATGSEDGTIKLWKFTGGPYGLWR